MVAAAARLSFLGHLRLPVTSFTSVTHSSLEGEAARAWQVGEGGLGAGRQLEMWVAAFPETFGISRPS